MDLNELGVAVLAAGPVDAAGGPTGANHRHRRAAIDQAAAARGDDHRVGGKAANFHRRQILADATAANAAVVEDRSEKVPVFELPDLALHGPAPHLIV